MPSIAWGTKVITVPQSELTLISGTTYEYNINTFRLALKDLEDDETGIAFLHTHNHTPPTSLGGILFARSVEIINGYTVTFENGIYGVDIIGGNHNLRDVLNRNSVSVNTALSAGLVEVTSGTGADWSAGEKAQILAATANMDAAISAVPTEVWSHADGTDVTARVALLRKALTNRMEQAPGNPGVLILYDDDGTTPLLTWQIRDATGGAVADAAGAPARRAEAT